MAKKEKSAKEIAAEKVNAYRKIMAKAPIKLEASAADATLGVNRYFEAAKVKGVWYVRNKNLKEGWKRALLTAALVCEDLEAGEDVSIGRRQIAI